jgi:CheY-like chemotaxis protein
LFFLFQDLVLQNLFFNMEKIRGILLIDDDFINNFINQDLLKNLGLSNEITDLVNPEGAMEFLKSCEAKSKNCPELILLDIGMPELDGFQFMQEFNELTFPNADRVQVVVLTTSTNPRDKERMEALGIKNFIIKPLTEESLQKVLDQHPVTAKI